MSMKSALLVALSAVHLTTVFSTDCDHNLDQCKALAWSTCHTLAGSCTTPDYCRSEFDLCKAAENATVSAPSEVESSSSAYEIERNVSTSEIPSDCDSQYRQCLDNSLKRSPFITVSRSLTAYLCHLSHDQCKHAENAVGRAWSETELISSLSEAERNASSSENSTDCDSEYRQCLDNSLKRSPFITVSRSLTAYFCRLSHDQCKHAENAVGRAWSETELISSLSEAERNASSSENSTESTTSVEESSSSASEVERSSSNSESFTDCKNELNRCALDVWDHCDPLKETCSLNVDDCFRSYDQCEAAEIDCDIEVKRCALDVWRCLLSKETCSLNDKDCFRSYDQCEAAKIVSTTSVGEASSSAAEVERSSSNPENFTDSTPSVGKSSSSASEVERSVSNSENLTDCDIEVKRCTLDVWHCLLSKETCSLNVDDCFRSHDQCKAAEIGNRDPANPICYE